MKIDVGIDETIPPSFLRYLVEKLACQGYLDVPGRKLGSMVRIAGLFNPKEYPIYK